MTISRTNDHEITIGSTKSSFRLLRDESNHAMYSVIEEPQDHKNRITLAQNNWQGGHGQLDIRHPDYYHSGQSIDTTNKGRAILAPLIYIVQEDDSSALDGNIVGHCWYPAIGKLMCWTATNIYRLDAEGWDVCATAVTGVTDMKVFGAILYAARGASTVYSYSADGDTFTATDLTDGYANGFLVAPNAAGTADILWKYKLPNEVSSTTDGRTVAGGGAQWSTANYVGDTANGITNLFIHANMLMIGKRDGLWQLDSEGGLHPLREELKTNISPNNFKYVTHWQTGTYHSEGTQLGEMVSIKFEPMGALYGIDNIGKEGTTVGLTADRDWLYQAVDEGTNTIIYRIREIYNSEDGLRWEVCPFVYLGTNACAAIQCVAHSDTDRRLWFGYGNYTAYVPLVDNPTADTSYNFVSSGTLRTSYFYGSNSYWDKIFESIVTHTKGCSTYSSGGTVTNLGGTCNGSPVSLVAGANTITVTGAGTFTVAIPTGATGMAISGSAVVTGTPLNLPAGSTIITVAGTGTITIYADIITVTPYYFTNESTTAVALTSAITTNGTVKTNLSSVINCNRISLQFALATNNPYKTPELLYYQLRGYEKPEVTRIIECIYDIGDSPSKRSETVLNILRGARTSTALIKYADLRFGDSVVSGYSYAIVPAGYPQEYEYVGEKSRQPEMGVKMRWEIVNWS